MLQIKDAFPSPRIQARQTTPPGLMVNGSKTIKTRIFLASSPAPACLPTQLGTKTSHLARQPGQLADAEWPKSMKDTHFPRIQLPAPLPAYRT
jgi:hypothetical protein